MHALDILCGQLTPYLFVIAKFLLIAVATKVADRATTLQRDLSENFFVREVVNINTVKV